MKKLLSPTLLCGTALLLATNAGAAEPANFGWAGDRSTTSWYWDDPAGWTNFTDNVREIPGYVAGDTLSTAEMPAGSRTFLLTNNVTLAAMTVGPNAGGYAPGPVITFAPGDSAMPVVVNLQTTDGSPAAINIQNLPTLQFGRWADAGNISFNLHQSLNVVKTYGQESSLVLNAPVTGGSPGDTILLDVRDSNGFSVYFRNTVNTFRADIVIAGNANNRSFKLVCGNNSSWLGFLGDDRMFGDPANRIIGRTANYVILFFAPAPGFTLNRTFAGLGEFRSLYFHEYNLERDTPRPLILGPDARIEPGVDDNLGELTLTASTIDFNPGATIRVKVRPGGASDKVNFRLRSNAFHGAYTNTWPPLDPEPGTLNLGGKVEFIEQGGHIPSGTSWVIGQTSYTNTILTGKIKSATPGFIIHAEQEPGGIWNIIATKNNSATRFLLK